MQEKGVIIAGISRTVFILSVEGNLESVHGSEKRGHFHTVFPDS